MHIAFVSLGAFGHINPTLALVTELVKKGVRVTYFTTEAFRTIIEPTGAKFVAVPSWMAENDKHNEDGEKKEDDGGVAAAGQSIAHAVGGIVGGGEGLNGQVPHLELTARR